MLLVEGLSGNFEIRVVLVGLEAGFVEAVVGVGEFVRGAILVGSAASTAIFVLHI